MARIKVEWFPARMLTLRQNRKMKRAALGRATGLSATAIYNFEHGLREPTYSSIVALAKGLDVSPNAFFEEKWKDTYVPPVAPVEATAATETTTATYTDGV